MTINNIETNSQQEIKKGDETDIPLNLQDFVEAYKARRLGVEYEQSDYIQNLVDKEVGDLASLVVDAIDTADSDTAFSPITTMAMQKVLSSVLRIKSGEPNDNYLRSAQQEMRKGFILSVVQHYNEKIDDDLDNQAEAKELANRVQELFVSMSPNITDYIGDIGDQIDVAVAAQAAPYMDRLAWNVKEEAMQNITFSKSPDKITDTLVNHVVQASPVNQLQTLKLYESMSQHATAASYGERATDIFIDTFSDIKNASDSNALTAIVAGQYCQDTLERRLNNLTMTGSHSAELTYYEEFGLNRRIALPDGWKELYRPAIIASDAIGVRDRYGVIRQVASLNEEITGVSDDELALSNAKAYLSHPGADQWEFFDSAKMFLNSRLDGDAAKEIQKASNSRDLRSAIDGILSSYDVDTVHFKKSDFDSVEDTLGGDGEKANLLQIVHTPEIRGMLENSTGINLAEIPLSMQTQLLDYMTRRSLEDFSRLSKTASKIRQDGGSTTSFFEAFLATEFGDDLGEQILALAEQPQNAEKLDGQIGHIRNVLNSVREFTVNGVFEEVDESLADDIRRGISTRTSEILYALNQRLSKNKPIDKVEVALAKLDEWSSGVAEMLNKGTPRKVQETGNTKLYHFMDPETGKLYPGAVELTTNGKFAEDATARERLVKEGRGARMSFTYDKAQPSVALSLKGPVRRGAMNGRLDKSVYNIKTGQSEPDVEQAEVSFDIASMHGEKESESRQTAEVIGEGSAIRDTGNGNKGGSKNFTYDIIDQDWGNRERFAGAVLRFGEVLDGRARRARQNKLAHGALEQVAA